MQENKTYAYAVGEKLIYQHEGICVVKEIRKISFAKNDPHEYYILEPLYTSSSTEIFVPVHAKNIESRMRRLITKDEILSVIRHSEEQEGTWVEDSKKRYELFSQRIREGERTEILRVIKMLSLHKLKVEKQGKKFYATDERLLEAAMKDIVEEFSYVLGVAQKDVIPYIVAEVEKAHASC